MFRGLTWHPPFHVFHTTIDFQYPPIVRLWPAHPELHTSPNIKASPIISLPLYHHIPYRHLCLYGSLIPPQTYASLNCHLSSLARKTVIFLKIFLRMGEVFLKMYQSFRSCEHPPSLNPPLSTIRPGRRHVNQSRCHFDAL